MLTNSKRYCISIALLIQCLQLLSQQSKFSFQRFTIDNGLSQNLVSCIAQDQQGFMWFGTKNGLDRFDGYEFKIFHHKPFDTTSLSDDFITALFTNAKGRMWVGTFNGGLNLYDRAKNRFIRFLVSQDINGKIYGNRIIAITEDGSGNVWVATSGNGLYKFSFHNQEELKPAAITQYTQELKGGGLISNFVSGLYIDGKQRLWLAFDSGGIQYADLRQKAVQFYLPHIRVFKAKRTIVASGIQYEVQGFQKQTNTGIIKGKAFFEDSLHRLWIGAANGLFSFYPEQESCLYFDVLMPGIKQAGIASVESICKGTDGSHSLWLGVFTGAGLFDTKTYSLSLIENQPGNPESLLPGRLLSIYKDRSDCIWLGSNGYGVSKYNTRSSLFSIPRYHSTNKTVDITDLSIHSFFDTEKYLLIGATDGLWMAEKNSGFMHRVNLNDSAHLNSNLIYSIIPAGEGAVWLASNIGFIWYRPSDNKVRLFFPSISGNGQNDERIFKLYKAKNGYIWCLTPYSLSVFNPVGQTFTHYYYNHINIDPDSEPTYGDIYQDKKGNFWIGTVQGLLYFDASKKIFLHYTTKPGDPSSLSFNDVRCITPDPLMPDIYLWIGTAGGGLNKFNTETKKFVHFTEKDGLPDNVIYGILTDNSGSLWMSTNKGIVKFNPGKNIFYKYDVDKGLQNNQFNANAFYKNAKGQLFFGGIHGFNAFYPDNIKDNANEPPVVFTDFRLFNQSVAVNEKNSPLERSIAQTQRIVLPYRDNIISFEVAALDYADPSQNKYAYRLDNFNNDWVMAGNERLINFSNLHPGKYVLRVKAANSEGLWNDKGISLTLIILPPWYKTWWAYGSYLLLLIAALYFFRRYDLRRIRLKNSLVLQHLETQKLKELDHLKSRFFANISHEFRTPLTLILGPLEDLLNGESPERLKNLLPEMHRSSKRLLQLINQLLDLSKLDAGYYHLNTNGEDIIRFTNRIVKSFGSMAERKKIDLWFEVDKPLKQSLLNGETCFYFDEDVMEKIITNLLSNAIKFTQRGGEITVRLSKAPEQNEMLELIVKDNGTGIAADKLNFIFDRFYQADSSSKREYEGSGIGLALVKELVQLHNGNIAVESKLNEGTVFRCFFPLNKKIVSEEAVGETTIESNPPIFISTDEEIKPSNTTHKGNPIILIVEDQPDVRKYVCEKLKDNFTTEEAQNGNEGLEKAFRLMPDLIISDVMMPGTDGFELCKTLKTDDRTSHIPVILLTARAEESDRLEGLETGADAYLLKPFNAKELLIRVHKLIELRNKLRAKFSGRLVIKPSEISTTSRDQQFMQRLLDIVEKHFADDQFSVEKLAHEFGMSPSQINRKLNALINQSAIQFINSIRLQRAHDLLKNKAGNVSEIAYQTGFNDPGYFSRLFKKHFGYLPSEAR